MTTSPLLTCPLDIFSGITSYLPEKDVMTLYCTDKGPLRSRLTKQGGVKGLVIRHLTPTQFGNTASFPMFPCRFSRLQSLTLQFSVRIPRLFVIGSLLFLPKSLTFLEMRMEYSMTAWLQPSEWPGNNDDGPFTQTYKPIYIDNLLPNLQTLILTGSNSDQFTPSPASRLAGDVDDYFDAPLRSFMPAEMRSIISRHVELKMLMRWPREMRVKWLQHLPNTLTAVQLNCSVDDIFSYLPTNLCSISLSGAASLSFMPESLKNTLSVLEMPVTHQQADSPALSYCFPPHLTDLTITTGYSPMPSLLLDSLPPELTRLRLQPTSTVYTIPVLPPTLRILHLGECPISDLVRNLPTQVTELSVNGRAGGLAALVDLPLRLRSLTITGDSDLNDDIVKILPRNLEHLGLEGNTHDPLTNAGVLLLPQFLRSLALGQCSHNLSDSAIIHLPRTITSLQLGCNHLSDAVAELLPQNITHLQLDQCRSLTDAVIPRLPKSLTSLQIISLVATGSLLEPGIKRLTQEEVSASILAHLHPDIARSKAAQKNQRYYDKFFFSYDVLSHIPSSVTEVNYPGASIMHQMLLPLPHLVSLTLPDCSQYPITNLSYSMPFLHTLILPKFSDATRGAVLRHLPAGLTQLDLSGCSICDVPAEVYFPLNLTSLRAFAFDQAALEKLAPIDSLTTLSILSSNLGLGDNVLKYLPKNLTNLHVGSARTLTAGALRYLPPNLRILHLPDSHFSNECISYLPPSLDSFQVSTFTWNSLNGFASPPQEMTSFESPSSCVALIVAQSNSESDIRPKIEAKTTVVTFNDELAMWLPPHLTTFKARETHSAMTNTFIERLPRTITHLDLGKQQTGLTPDCALLLPPNLKILVLWASEFTEASFIGNLPKSITDLELVRMPGRLTAPKAAALPSELVRLRLGLTIVGNEALSSLPRTITNLELANTPFITDDGVANFPPQLKRLFLPTSRLTAKCAESLPVSLTSLSLGAGCSVPPSFVISRLQELRHQAEVH